MPNISTLAILEKSAKENHPKMPIRDPLNEFPRALWIGLVVLGIAIYSVKRNPEFSGICLEMAFGIPKSRFRGKMKFKLICLAAVRNTSYFIRGSFWRIFGLKASVRKDLGADIHDPKARMSFGQNKLRADSSFPKIAFASPVHSTKFV